MAIILALPVRFRTELAMGFQGQTDKVSAGDLGTGISSYAGKRGVHGHV